MTIYADDIAIWCVGASCHATPICVSLQRAVSAVSSRLTNLGLSVSPAKTASLLFRWRGRLRLTSLPPFLNGRMIQCVRCRCYLGLLVDDLVSWYPAVKETLAAGRFISSVLYKLGGPAWGMMQESLLPTYRGLACLYTIPVLSLNEWQWGKLELLHCVALCRWLGVPKYASSIHSLNPRICKLKCECLGTLNAFTELHRLQSCFNVTWTGHIHE